MPTGGHKAPCLAVAWAVSLGVAAGSGAQAGPRTLRAEAFGVRGDGAADEGPAIRRMLAAAAEADGPVTLQFPRGGTFRVATGDERYVFRFAEARQITLDGGGGMFVLAPNLRFLSLTNSDDITVRRLSVDFDPLPFVDGIVAAIDPEARTLEVRLAQSASAPVGEPTGEDGEQAFFAMLWHDGPYGPLSRHCWVDRIEEGDTPGTACVHPAESFDAWDQVVPGAWRISLPVPGIAHRYGPGPCFAVADNESVTFEDVELWSAPWFGFSVSRNRGRVVFRRVNLRPKPGSERLMSLWRDGFHVKGNPGSLLWEDCEIAGMNDDAFNISTHASVVERVPAPTRIEVRQKFPLLPIPWRVGATLTAADEEARSLLGEARITGVEVGPTPPPIQGQPAAPLSTLQLETPVEGLRTGTLVWDAAQCNPDTTLRRCRIRASCRMQSPVRLEGCEVEALLWFYCEPIEGGFPHHVTLERCVLKRGRGNPTLAVVFAGAPAGEAASRVAGGPARAIHDITLRENEIWGGFVLTGVQRAVLVRNRFRERGAPITLHGNFEVITDGNTDPDGKPLWW